MSGDTRDNVYIFPSADSAAGGGGDAGTALADAAADDVDRDPAVDASDLRAMAECLQHLYRESHRLDAKTTSRLIGAAAMAVAEDIRERER
jgi:predicted lipid-binding transport protein (Tim44 family)